MSEFNRAKESGTRFHLVIVEDVDSDNPLITIVEDPVARLEYTPAGDVNFRNWKNLEPRTRVIELQASL